MAASSVDRLEFAADNSHMATTTTALTMKELTEAVHRMMSGVRDAAVAQKAREDMNRMREETRKRIGTVEVAVDLIRDAREQ